MLGRLSTEVARILRGKHKPIFAPHMDTGDHVIVVNADKVVLTAGQGREEDRLPPLRLPRRPQATQTYTDLLATKPEEAVRKAIKGMLPKTALGRQMLTKLKVYAGPTHPHAAQSPKSSICRQPADAKGVTWRQAAHPDHRSPQARRRPRPPPPRHGRHHLQQAGDRRVLPVGDPPDDRHRAAAPHRDRSRPTTSTPPWTAAASPARPAPCASASPGRSSSSTPSCGPLKKAGFLTRDARRSRRSTASRRPARRRSTPSARSSRSRCRFRFGTDGVRGVANVELTPELVLALGRAAARGARQRLVIGRDTRVSGPMLDAALAAGLAAEGCRRRRPRRAAHAGGGVAVRQRGRPGGDDLGVAQPLSPTTASSCSPPAGASSPTTSSAARGRAVATPPGGARTGVGGSSPRHHRDALRTRVQLARRALARRADGRHRLRQRRRLSPSRPRCSGRRRGRGAPRAPDGININAGCGSTHPRRCSGWSEPQADVGLAFDGDADRVLAVDHRRPAGRRRPDHRHLRHRSANAGLGSADTVVVTVMTNLGFRLAMTEHGIRVVETAVGDRYVLEALEAGRLLARRRAVRPRDLPRPGHHRRRHAHRAAAARRGEALGSLPRRALR